MTSLKIHDSLSRKKREFVPIEPGKVRMYVCGITVYDYCHIGHARLMVAFDVVQRWLRRSGYDVTYVRNVTDIDDKIIRRAVENNETIAACTARFTQYMHEDEAALGVEQPDHVPYATHFIGQMHDIISRLEKRGLAYQAESGDVNFSVHDFPGYGQLSGKSLDELRAGERVEVNTDKRSPLDFVLWKSAKPDEPEEVKWDSPWGRGRPGWHIECSAMACSVLGEKIDIHGGGQDLTFPHHENEIAQSEGAFGGPFAATWMHNGFVQIDNEKMSKSLGNFFTIRDALKQYDGEVIRFFLLRAQYRTQINYSPASLDDARQGLAKLYTALKDTPPDGQPLDQTEAYAIRFADAMNDDFNTPEAVAVLYALANEVNRTGSAALARQLKGLGGDLGMLASNPVEYLQREANPAATGAAVLTPTAIDALIKERLEARASRDFARSDQIRASLLGQGVALEDRPGNRTEWRRV